MWRRFLMIGVVFAFGMMLLTPSTRALDVDEEFVPCEQEVLEGTWNVEVGAVDEFGNHTCWEPCNLTISATGSVEQGGTYTDCSGVSSAITGGELALSYGCLIEGYIETSNGTFYMATGTIAGEDQLVLGRAEE